jgi:predicted outer membrane repeat protein
VNASNVTLSNSIFRGNKSPDIGGAVRVIPSDSNPASIVIDNCSFADNSAVASGGAIFVSDGSSGAVPIILNRSRFENNTAGDAGGAVYLSRVGSLTLINGAFRGNGGPSVRQGGGIYIGVSEGPVVISDSTFARNRIAPTNSSGGAILIRNASRSLDISNSTFTDNGGPCEDGGALAIESTGDAFTLENVSFEKNVAKWGGAVSLRGLVGALVVKDCHFASNGDPTATRLGGGIGVFTNTSNYLYLLYSTRMYDVRLLNNVFESNTAQWGGALYLGQLVINVFVINNTFEYNMAYGSGGQLMYGDYSDYAGVGTDMQPGGGGGAIYNYASYANTLLKLCVFRGNQALSGQGGATLSVNSNMLTIFNTTFEENQALDGGAIFTIGPSYLIMEWVDLVGNTALGSGGAINAGRGTAIVSISIIFVNNTSADYGGGLSCHECVSMTDTESIFDGNSARSAGGMGLTRSTNFKLTGTQFLNNRADLTALSESYHSQSGTYGLGGGLSISASSPGQIVQAGFVNNSAAYGGGAYLSSVLPDAYALIQNCSFEGNRAMMSGAALFAAQIEGLSLFCSDAESDYLNPRPITNPNELLAQGRSSIVSNVSSALGCPEWSNNTASSGVGSGIATMSYAIDLKVSTNLSGSILSGSSLSFQAHLKDFFGLRVLAAVEADRSTLLASTPTRSASVLGATYGVFVNSSVQIDGLVIQGKPGGTDITFSASFLGGSNSIVKPSLSQSVTLSLRPCILGETTNADNTLCTSCPPLFFSLNPKDQHCSACLSKGINCSHPQAHPQSQPIIFLPQDGYWQPHPLSPIAYKCPRANACSYDNRSQALLTSYARYMALVSQVNGSNVTAVSAIDSHTQIEVQCAQGESHESFP